MDKRQPQRRGTDRTSKMTPSTNENSNPLEDNEFLRWQIERLETFKDTLSDMNAKKAIQIEALEAAKETLKADLETATAKIQEMQKQIEERDAEKKKLFDETLDLHSQLMDSQLQRYRDTEALEKKLSDSHDSVAALKKEHESDLLRLRADWDRELAEEQAKWEEESVQKKKKDDEEHAVKVIELNYDHLIEGLQYKEQLASLEAKLKEQKQSFASALTAEKSSKIAITHELREQKDRNWKLQIAICDQNNLKAEIHELRGVIKEKDRIIKTKDEGLDILSSNRQRLIEQWLSSKDSQVTTVASLNDLRKRYADLQSKLKATRSDLIASNTWQEKVSAELLEASNDNKDLLTQKKKLTSQVAEQKKKIHELESTQQRFKTDLEACSSSMSDFRALKSKHIELCRRYLHNYKPRVLNMDLEDQLREQIASANRKISSYQQDIKKDIRDVKYYKDLLYKNLDRAQFYIDKVHKLEKANYSLRNELRHTQLLLQKATKPVQQKVKSWVNKKILGRVPVAPEAAEEPPALYPNDWQPSDLPDDNIPSDLPDDNIPSDLPDDNITSSAHPCPSEPTTSLEPDPLDGVILVEPCVVDLPPVDL
ncbi:hypothetical protein ABVT39_006796 [Epinephelus coioides]